MVSINPNIFTRINAPTLSGTATSTPSGAVSGTPTATPTLVPSGPVSATPMGDVALDLEGLREVAEQIQQEMYNFMASALNKAIKENAEAIKADVNKKAVEAGKPIVYEGSMKMSLVIDGCGAELSKINYSCNYDPAYPTHNIALNCSFDINVPTVDYIMATLALEGSISYRAVKLD